MYRILVISFYLLICLLASAIAEEISADHTNSTPYQITTGALHSCAIDDEGVKCWGENEHSQLEVPPLSNPMQISSSFLHTCAIDDTGVVCWGWNRYKQLENIPAINDLQEISAGYYSTCVIDQGDVVCWGAQNISRVKILLAYKDKWDPVARFPVPQAKNPRSLSVGANHGCVIDDSGVICWGANNHGQTEIPPLANPRKVRTQEDRSCALDDSGVVCWGLDTLLRGSKNILKNINTSPELKNPYDLGVGGVHTCSLDDTGPVCWGYDMKGQTKPPLLRDPIEISVSANNGCALTLNGVTCWGYNKNGQTEPSKLSLDRRKLLTQYLHRRGLDEQRLKADWQTVQEIKAQRVQIEKAFAGFRQYRRPSDISYSPPIPRPDLTKQPFETTEEFRQRLRMFRDKLSPPELLVSLHKPSYDADSSEWYFEIPDSLLLNSNVVSASQYQAQNSEGGQFLVNKKSLLEEKILLTNADETLSSGLLTSTSRFPMPKAQARNMKADLVYVLLLDHQGEDPSNFFEEPIGIYPSIDNPRHVTGTRKFIKMRIKGLALMDTFSADKVISASFAVSQGDQALLAKEADLADKISLLKALINK